MFSFWSILWMAAVCEWGQDEMIMLLNSHRPFCSLCQTSIMLSNVYTAIQRREYITLANAAQFPPQINPTWLAISVSVLPWLEENAGLGGRQTTDSKEPMSMLIPAEEYTQWKSPPVHLCVGMRYMWYTVRAHLSAVRLLQDRVEPQPIFTEERDVGRHLPRQLWSHPRRLAAQVSANLTDCWEDLYIWCHHRRMMKCSAWNRGDNWADGTLTSGSLVALLISLRVFIWWC